RSDIARKIALMAQLSTAYFSYTVYETVMLGRYAHVKRSTFAGESTQDREIVLDCLARTGMLSLKDTDITQLSGGQLQRVFLARTFAQSPQIILLDEPTNHLDLKYQLELTQYLRDWVKQDGRCVVGVLHDINLALSFADSLLLMQDGRVFAEGPAEGFDLSLISRIYGVDVGGYMRSALKRWE
ncbi:MAG: ABC transporter ATP-binding protein, partial [Ruthenibacterium sp.]